jgi:hypothetical protein
MMKEMAAGVHASNAASPWSKRLQIHAYRKPQSRVQTGIMRFPGGGRLYAGHRWYFTIPLVRAAIATG